MKKFHRPGIFANSCKYIVDYLLVAIQSQNRIMKKKSLTDFNDFLEKDYLDKIPCIQNSLFVKILFNFFTAFVYYGI